VDFLAQGEVKRFPCSGGWARRNEKNKEIIGYGRSKPADIRAGAV